MQKLKINEIFYSLQGEGANAGMPAIFIRLAHCNTKCHFCDTEFDSFSVFTQDGLLENIKQYNCKNIIWTGGEPTIHLNNDIVLYFKRHGYYQAIETNGIIPAPKDIDYISLSPKCSLVAVMKNYPDGVDEIRLAFNADMKSLPMKAKLPNAKHYFLSPIFDGDELNQNNLKHCINIIMDNPGWKLSIQQHKIWNLQ